MRTSLILVVTISLINALTAQYSEKDEFISELMSEMTLDEKIGQMNQYTGFYDPTGPVPTDGNAKTKYDHIKKGMVGSVLNVRGTKEVRALQEIAVTQSRLGIPLIFGFDVIHGYKTIMPIPLAEAASWDLESIEMSARLAAEEATASGLNWTFAPMMDIGRDPRWGRVMEGAGEDPYLGSLVAEARVRGFQGTDMSEENTMAACAKHFAAYGFAESGRDYNTADIGLSTLHNIVLPPFKAAAQAGVATFMNSFNELNGIPATGDISLQRLILKGKWNFQGFVVSDWGSIGEMIPHGFAEDGAHAAEIAVNAGSDMDMESHLYIHQLNKLVQSGDVDLSVIDEAVKRILGVKYDLGLFADPYKYCNEEREAEILNDTSSMAQSLDIARKSIVLLKNENGILPLQKSGNHIAVIGALGNDKNSPLGSWRFGSVDNSAVSVVEGMSQYKDNNLSYEEGIAVVKGETSFANELDINISDRTGLKEAVELAGKADYVVMVLGEHGYQSGEGRSRTDIGLPGLQQELLEKVFEVNSNIILVLMNGRPLTLEWADQNIPAIVETWHLGSQSGNAIAEVLYGDYNPSGKLPMTFPRNVGQIPIYYNCKNTGRPGPQSQVFWSHYTDQTNDPLYVFGHGLSYTTFEYQNLNIEVDGHTVIAKVTVKNSGNRSGEEVIQLYIHDKVASVTRPIKELKGFSKVYFAKGETKVVEFVLSEKELGFYNNDGEYVIEPGSFDLIVGGSSKGELKSTFSLK